MEMEGEEGTMTVGKSKSVTLPPPQRPEVPPSAPVSRSGTSAKVEEGDEGRQVKAPGEGDDGGGSEAIGDDDDARSPVREDCYGPAIRQDSEDCDRSSESSEDVDQMGDKKAGDEDPDTGNCHGGGGSPSSSSESLGHEVEEEGELHPMKNPVILKNLFEVCPPGLLKNFRLVCKDWRDLSLGIWRSSITLRLQETSGDEELHVGVIRKENGSVIIPLKELVKYVEAPNNQCLSKPFRRFHLHCCDFWLGYLNKQSVKGWELVKREVTVLTLELYLLPDVQVWWHLKDCSKLVQLNLVNCNFHPPSSEKPISIGVHPENLHLKSLSLSLYSYSLQSTKGFKLPWLELFSQFPTLTRFSLTINSFSSFSSELPELLVSVLEAIKTIRKQDPRKLPLKEFDLDPCLEIPFYNDQFCQVFSLLRELSIPIRSLEFCLEIEDEASLNELPTKYEIHSESLRSLTFCLIAWDWAVTWKFPFPEPLENLQVLIMNNIFWESMEFLKLVPNLRRLKLLHWYYEDDPRFCSSSESVSMISNTLEHTMTGVQLLGMRDFVCYYELSEDDLRKLASWFPNLSRLHVELDDLLFPIVCELWPDLKVITVNGYSLTDRGITGLRADQIVEDPETIQLPPNIGLLQNLTEFSYPNGAITDVSIFHGFLKLPRLTLLRVSEKPSWCSLSTEAKAALKETGRIHLEYSDD